MKLYGIKNCSQVKKAKDCLILNKEDYQEIDVRKDGLAKEIVKHWIDCRSLEEVLNKRSKVFKDLDLGSKVVDETMFLDLIEKHPLLFKRPLLVKGDKVFVGLKEIEAIYSN
ncbi:MAG: arsenate reductase [Candidatus Cloacimonadota bacterium]|nr:MAG: arsenate reductase [Candidatus Cloacimonadota bacterium]